MRVTVAGGTGEGGVGGGVGTGGGQGGANPEMAYLRYVGNLVKQNWTMPSIALGRQDMIAVVQLDLDRDGRILSFQLVQSSGRSEFDISAQKAVALTQSNEVLEPPPTGRPLTFTITFNSMEQRQ